MLSLQTIFALEDVGASPNPYSIVVEVGDSESQVFTITNTGDTTVNTSNVVSTLTSGSNSMTVSLSDSSFTGLAAGQSTSLTMSFTAPTTAGTYTGTIDILNQGTSTLLESIPLSIQVLDTSQQNFSVDKLSITKTSNANEDVTEIITITNTGSDALYLDITDTNLVKGTKTIDVTTTETAINNLQPGQTKQFGIIYNTGNNGGNFTGKITITNRYDVLSKTEINLQDTISNINLQTFSLNPSTLSELIEINSTLGRDITVTATGEDDVDLTISLENLVDTSNSANTITPTIDTTTITGLSSGNSETITYTIPATSEKGTYTGKIIFTNSNDNSKKTEVPVTITIYDPSEISLTLDGVDSTNSSAKITLDGLEIDQKESESLTIKNTGSVDLQITSVKFTDFLFDGDEISDSDFDIDNDDDSFELKSGRSHSINFDIDVPQDIKVGVYEGELQVVTQTYGTFTWTINLDITTNEDEVKFSDNGEDVRSGILKLFGEPGETINEDNRILIENNGNIDWSDLTISVKEDLKREEGSEILPASAISFSRDTFDILADDDEKIDVDVALPEDIKDGTYTGELELRDSKGDLLDRLSLEVKVIGDVYISSIEGVDKTYKPGDVALIKVTVNNQGTSLIRNVQVRGTLNNIDVLNSDDIQTSTKFPLQINDKKTVELQFRIPKDAKDGDKSLDIELLYDDQSIVEYEKITISRDDDNIAIQSYSINPRTAKCDNQIYTYIKATNYGKFDEDVVYSATIENTGIFAKTNTFEFLTDDTIQKNLVLDISDLEPGTYNVIQTLEGSSKVSKTSILTVQECKDTSVGVEIKPLNESLQGNQTTNQNNSIQIFGYEMEKETAYLAGGLSAVIILIVTSLFFL
jgi:uncharacterized membrane protein